MQQKSFLEADIFWAGQEIPHFFCNPMVRHLTHKLSPPIQILSLIKTLPVFSAYLFKIHFIILPSKVWFSKRPLSLIFFLTKLRIYPSSPPFMLHAPAIPLFLIVSAE